MRRTFKKTVRPAPSLARPRAGVGSRSLLHDLRNARPLGVTCHATPAKCRAKRTSPCQRSLEFTKDPYGKVAVLDADFTADADNKSDFDNPYLYTGRVLDPETGLYFYRARYYHAGLGVFVSRDPVGYLSGSLNLYGYVRGNPLAFTDPTGLASSSQELTVAVLPGLWIRTRGANTLPDTHDFGFGEMDTDKRFVIPPGWHKILSSFIPSFPKEVYIDEIEWNYVRKTAPMADQGWNVIYAANIADANSQLTSIAPLTQKCPCVKTLKLYGHGWNGMVRIGATRSPMADDLEVRGAGWNDGEWLTKSGFQLFAGIRFCKPCVVELHACYAGRDNNGKRLMREIYALTRCAVKATDRGYRALNPLFAPNQLNLTHP